MRKKLIGPCALLFGMCAWVCVPAAERGTASPFATATLQAKSDNLAYASLDNVPYGMLGSWFDPATAGQGFDVQFYADTDHSNAAILYWYTFDPAGKQKVWFLALGPIAGTTAHLQIAEPSHYQKFDQAAPPGTQNEAVGSIEFQLADCSHAHISWHFERALSNGLDATNDGQADLQRLTPVFSVLGKDLCSTPLSAFSMPGPGSGAQLDQCVANYNGLLGQFQNLNSDYGLCIDTAASDETTIDDLHSELAELQADIDGAYEDGYAAGNSAGYDQGYGDGYSDGYDEGSGGGSYDLGYNAGYGDGYSAGYDEGSSSCTAYAGVPLAKAWAGSSTPAVYAQPRILASHTSSVGRDASAARARAQQSIRKITQQLEQMKKQRGQQN